MSVQLYSEREDWKDVTPIPPCKEDLEIFRVDHDQKTSDIFMYVRAVLKSKEISERVMELFQDAIKWSPSCPVLWVHRREIIKALKLDCGKELKFTREILIDDPKCYQPWYHRMEIVKISNDPSLEWIFVREVLLDDNKNYHAWQHAQFVAQTFNQYEDLNDLVTFMLDKDIYNNSAWNSRHSYLFHTDQLSTPEKIKKEISYILSLLELYFDNACLWSYLFGIGKKLEVLEFIYVLENVTEGISKKIHKILTTNAENEEVASTSSDSTESLEVPKINYDEISQEVWKKVNWQAAAFIVDFCVWWSIKIGECDRDTSKNDHQSELNHLIKFSKTSVHYAKTLALTLDHIRRNFWISAAETLNNFVETH